MLRSECVCPLKIHAEILMSHVMISEGGTFGGLLRPQRWSPHDCD